MNPTPDFAWYATFAGPLVSACGFIIAASVAVKGWKATAALAFENQRQILRMQVLNEARKATADEIRAYQAWLRELRATYSLFSGWNEDAKDRPESWARVIERLEESVFKKEVDFSRWERRLDEYEALFPETSNLRRFLWLEGSQIQIRKNNLLWIEPQVEEWISSKQNSEPKTGQP